MEFLRRRLGLILRALVSLFLIGLLFYKQKIDWYQVWTNVRAMDGEWLAAAFLCFAPVVLIVAWRWRMLLGVHGVYLRFWRVLELTMIGQFFSAFLLGTTGGDVVKIYYVARAVPQRKTAVAFTVIVDRVIGLVALLLFGVGLSCTQLGLLLSTADTRFFTGLFYLFALGGIAASVLACLGPSLLQHPVLRNLVKKLPFVHRGAALFEAYEITARALGINCLAFFGSLPSHLCNTLMGYCIMRAMHPQPEPDLLAFCAVVAMVNMLIALPISISGLGVREQLFIIFLGLLGIEKEHALTFSLTYFVVGLTWSLLSGPFYFLYRHETHTPPPNVVEVEPIFSER
jgi:uncharacterized membrane protein YbhN (UPF0104 family)